MKKLIAKRPIQYQGRSYQRGELVPANDPVMTAAWLRAGSAEWEAAEASPVPSAAEDSEALRRKAERQACEVLAFHGVAIADTVGEFVGEESLTEQLRLLGQRLAQEYADVIPPEEGAPAEGGLPEEVSEEEPEKSPNPSPEEPPR